MLAKLDEFIRQTLVSKGRNGRRSWLYSNDKCECSDSCIFKVYVRVPIGAVIKDLDKPFTLNGRTVYTESKVVGGGNGWNVLDVASIEATPDKEGMGTYFFDQVEAVAIGRGLEYIRVESVNSPHVETITNRKGYGGDGCGNFQKKIR